MLARNVIVNQQTVYYFLIEYRTEIISIVKRKYATMKESDKDKKQSDTIMKSKAIDISEFLNEETKKAVSEVLEELNLEDVAIKDYYEIILEIICEELRKKRIELSTTTITKYISECKVQLVSFILQMCAPVSEEIEEKEISSLDEDEISEDILTPARFKEHISPELDKEISVIITEINLESLPHDICEILIFETVYEELQKKDIFPSMENVSKYIIEYRTEIIKIIKLKYITLISGEPQKYVKSLKEMGDLKERTVLGFKTEITEARDETGKIITRVEDREIKDDTENIITEEEAIITEKKTFRLEAEKGEVSDEVDSEKETSDKIDHEFLFQKVSTESVKKYQVERPTISELESKEISGVIKTFSADDKDATKDFAKETADISPRKDVYEKPEAELVFRDIFATTVIDDEIEVLPGQDVPKVKILSSDEKFSDDVDVPSDEKQVSPTSMTKVTYVEVEFDETVSSTTDKSSSTDVSEIPYEGKHREITLEEEEEVSECLKTDPGGNLEDVSKGIETDSDTKTKVLYVEVEIEESASSSSTSSRDKSTPKSLQEVESKKETKEVKLITEPSLEKESETEGIKELDATKSKESIFTEVSSLDKQSSESLTKKKISEETLEKSTVQEKVLDEKIDRITKEMKEEKTKTGVTEISGSDNAVTGVTKLTSEIFKTTEEMKGQVFEKGSETHVFVEEKHQHSESTESHSSSALEQKDDETFHISEMDQKALQETEAIRIKCIDDSEDKKQEHEVVEVDDNEVHVIKKVVSRKIVTTLEDDEDGQESIDVTESDDGDSKIIRKVITRKIVTTLDEDGDEDENIQDGQESIDVTESDDGDRKIIRKVITRKIVTTLDEDEDEGENIEDGQESIDVTESDDGDRKIIRKVITRKVVTTLDEDEDEDENIQVIESDDSGRKIIRKVITKKIVTTIDDIEDGDDSMHFGTDDDGVKVTKVVESEKKTPDDEEKDDGSRVRILETGDRDTRVIQQVTTKKTVSSSDDHEMIQESAVCDNEEISKTIISQNIDEEHEEQEKEADATEIQIIRKIVTTKIITSEGDQKDDDDDGDNIKVIESSEGDTEVIKKTQTATEIKTKQNDDSKESCSSIMKDIKDKQETSVIGATETLITTTITSQTETTEDTEIIEKSEVKTEDVTAESVTTTVIREYQDFDKLEKIKESKDKVDPHQSDTEVPQLGPHIKTVTKISTSESSESKDFKQEVKSTEEKSVKTVTTSVFDTASEQKDTIFTKDKFTSDSGSPEKSPTKSKFTSDSDSTEKSPTKSKSRRKIRKKIIVYHTGSEGSPEDFLTEDKIREAIIESGGKSPSKIVTRIVSSGTTEDFESFAGQGEVLEVKSFTETSTSETCETSSTEKTIKHEEIEYVEIDPFSLITKPLEESFKKRTEQTQMQETSEIKIIKSETSTQILEEKSSNTEVERDSDASPKPGVDTKVATDAKKLAMKTETSSSTSQHTEEQVQDATIVTQETSEAGRESTEEPSQTEDSTTTTSKSFNLDEWDKPMGLPSPPEPLEIENNITSLTRQNTTTSSKQEGDYSETKSGKNTSGENKSTLNQDADDNFEKESESVPEKEYKQSDNKEAEKSTEPVYIDLTYVPHFGDPHYCNADFFRRIRSRYYVFSGSKPSKEVFNALLEAKQEWKDKDAKVTIIPTYETDTLGYWMAVNQEALSANNIDVAPSASRCTINLQDHETSCSAYRLEL